MVEDLFEIKIIKSSDIGPVATNNPGAIYKSRPLSGMIHSAMSLRSLRSQSINLETGKIFCILNYLFVMLAIILTLINYLDPFYYYWKNNQASTGNSFI